jgi:toxin ParE1/3/4
VAVALVEATRTALNRLERDPGIGSPAPGRIIGVKGLKAWRIAGFPMTSFYFERVDHLDVVRLIGERRDVAAILSKRP